METEEEETGDELSDTELQGSHGRDVERRIENLGLSEEEIKSRHQAELIANSKVEEKQVDGVEIIGADEGEERVLVHMILDPRIPANRKLMPRRGKMMSDDQIREQFREALEKHCLTIGWWPDGEGPDFVVAKRDDGVWHAYAKTKKTRGFAKDWDTFPRMKIDGRTT